MTSYRQSEPVNQIAMSMTCKDSLMKWPGSMPAVYLLLQKHLLSQQLFLKLLLLQLLQS